MIAMLQSQMVASNVYWSESRIWAAKATFIECQWDWSFKINSIQSQPNKQQNNGITKFAKPIKKDI